MMRPATLLPGARAAALTLSLCALTAAPSSAAEVFLRTGASVSAHFSSLDGSGCVETAVSVDAFESVEGGPQLPGELSQSAFLSVFRYDVCQGLYLGSAFGFTGEFALRLDRQLDTAALVATIPLQDAGGSAGTALVDLAWIATGGPERTNSHRAVRSAGGAFVVHARGISRAAVAAGTLTDGSTNLTPGTSVRAQLDAHDGGSVMASTGGPVP